MSVAQAICEEFCEEVKCLYKFNISDSSSSSSDTELQCRLDPQYFTALMERLVEVGYCCTQVQKDVSQSTCTAWFEAASPQS